MKINWKDPFGKKRISQLEAENKILNDMLGQRKNYVGEIKELKIQKFKVNYRTSDSWLETPENRKFIQKELSKKLVEELYGLVSFDCRFDEDTSTYEYSASVEIVL